MRNKTDWNDARGIAQIMRTGWYRAVHVKGVETQRIRTLLANRRLLKRKLSDFENHPRRAPSVRLARRPRQPCEVRGSHPLSDGARRLCL
jgi:hypothetical protein